MPAMQMRPESDPGSDSSAFGYSFPMSLVYALFSGLSVGEVAGGVVMLFISVFAVFFWGSGLGWREPKKDRRNGL